MNALLELADRVEKADEPTRMMMIAAYAKCFGAVGPEPDARWQRFVRFLDAKAYENAAMSLVPEGWRTAMVSEMEHRDGWHWRLGAKSGTARFGKPGCDGLGLTPALALTAAALRARAASAGDTK